MLDRDRSIAEKWPVAGFILVGAPVLSSMMLSSSSTFSINFPLWSVFLWTVTIKVPGYNVWFG